MFMELEKNCIYILFNFKFNMDENKIFKSNEEIQMKNHKKILKNIQFNNIKYLNPSFIL